MELENKILQLYTLPLSYDNNGQFIVDSEEKKVADVRGWGVLQYQKNGEQLQDILGEMLVKAFNEKYGTNTASISKIESTIHQTFTFNKEPDGSWYIDLPEWNGSKDDLQMIMGADTMLDIFAEGEDKVSLLISETDVENTYNLKLLKETPELGGGGEYALFDIKEEYVMNVWLCKVTEHVFSKLPRDIFIAPVRL